MKGTARMKRANQFDEVMIVNPSEGCTIQIRE